MPYEFIFDLSQLPDCFYADFATIKQNRSHQKKLSQKLNELMSKYKIPEMTGLTLSDALVLFKDLISLREINTLERGKFLQTKERALFLPHCSRKYMDNRCKAMFNSDSSSYKCEHCSPDCLVNKADLFAKEKGYDVYVLPGGSCIPKILKAHRYEGIVGVACGKEIKSMERFLETGFAGQALPLIKNGCAQTVFNLEELANIL